MSKQYTIADFLKIKSEVDGVFDSTGNNVCYLSNESGVFNLYSVDLKKRTSGQLTDFADQIDNFAVSPNSQQLVFSLAKDGNEKTQLYIYDLSTRAFSRISTSDEAVHRISQGVWSDDGRFLTYSSNERNGIDFDVYVFDLASRSSRLVFSPGGWVSGLGFSPSGKYLIARQMHDGSNHDLFLIDIDTGINELLTPHDGRAIYEMVNWLRDESGFFLITDEETDLSVVAFFDLSARSFRKYEFGKDLIEEISLSPDNFILAVVSNQDGYGKIEFFETKNLTKVKTPIIPTGVISGLSWSPDSRRIVINFSSSVKGYSPYLYSLDDGQFVRLIDTNESIPSDVFVEPELSFYESFDGLQIPVFTFLPKNLVGQAPVIVYLHGGPADQFRPSFKIMIQYFVYLGYAVLAPNIRGSSGYGKNYQALDDREKRFDSIRDLAAVYDFCSKRHEFDAKKISLMGGSYGGYMVLAGLAFYPDLFVAGVDIVGMSNLVTFLENTAVWRRAVREAEYGYLATDRDFLQSISPLNFSDQIKAPLFIIHGKNDPRVPLSEARQIFDALQRRGLQTELVVYDDEGHGLDKLKNRLDAFPKIADFLNSVSGKNSF